MNAIAEFSFDLPAEPREKWPLKLPILRNGLPTSLRLPGCSLLHQFQLDDEFLFITDHDCPHEECTEFTLSDANLAIIGRRSLSVPYCSLWLKHVEWLDARRLRADIGGEESYVLTIRKWSIPLLFSRLSLRRWREELSK